MNMEKMTKRDYYNMIKAELANKAEIVAFCDKEIAALDNKAKKAKERAAKKADAGDELRDAVLNVLGDEFMTVKEICEALGENVSPNKVSYRANALVEANLAEKGEVTIKEEGTRARKLVAFKKV